MLIIFERDFDPLSRLTADFLIFNIEEINSFNSIFASLSFGGAAMLISIPSSLISLN